MKINIFLGISVTYYRYENGGFESSFTPAQLQQIRRITFAQVLCRTLDNIDDIQPFVFLAANNHDNERISCLNGLLNNFDLSLWKEIDNDISKAEEITKEPKTEKPNLIVKLTTTAKPTKNPPKTSSIINNKLSHKRPLSSTTNNTKPINNDTNDKAEPRVNYTDLTDLQNSSTVNKTNITKDNTVQRLDDKLDFRNKSKRFDDTNERSDDDRQSRNPTKYHNDYDYEEYDNSHSQQAIVINNLSYKRPSPHHHNQHTYKRPVIAVTENVDKFTYLINYVPKPTQSWRRTTKTPYKEPDRDVVKVTYQSYDNTYNRRPSRPYFSNRHEEQTLQTKKNDDSNYRHDTPDKFTLHDQLSSRSNEFTSAIPLNIKTNDNKPDLDTTTENYKLVTFRYVGTYKGHDFNDKNLTDDKTDDKLMSKDFSTYNNDQIKLDFDSTDTKKLSTFFLYETATKPYNSHRPTRRNDDDAIKENDHKLNKNKYYYVRNVLHKYPDTEATVTEEPKKVDLINENYTYSEKPSLYNDTQERSSLNKLAFLEEIESNRSSDFVINTVNKSLSAAKTPTVALQVIPSEER